MTKIKKIHLILLTAFLFLIPNLAFAAEPDVAGAINTQIQNLFSVLNVVLLFMQAFLWPILLLIGGLLNNDLLFSGGMETMLLNIWSYIRDFVNIMFVLGLLFIAIINIVGGDNKYAVKTVLPKIVVGLIAVNFSFLACKVVLDLVNVTSTAIFAMPLASTSLQKYSDPAQQDVLAGKICERMMKLSDKNASGTTNQAGLSSNPFCKGPDSGSSGGSGGSSTPIKYKLTDAGRNFFSTFNSRNAALVMAIELMDITDLDKVKSENVKGLQQLTINTLFSIVFFVIYATSFIALFVSLLVRLVVLWISIAISPLSALAIPFEMVKSTLGENDPFKLFRDHALIPLYVAPVLTIGMIMISQLKLINPGGMASTNPSDFGTLASNLTTLQDLIAGAGTAAFIWMAVKVALSRGKGKGFVDKVLGVAQNLGKTAMELPMYAPILPVYKGGEYKGSVGLGAMAGGLTQTPRFLQEEKEKQSKLLGGSSKDAALSDLDKANTKEDVRKHMANAAQYYKGEESERADVGKRIVKQIRDKKMVVDLKLSPELKKNYASVEEFLKKLEAGKVSEEEYNKFIEANGLKPGLPETGTTSSAAEDLLKKAGGSNPTPELKDKADALKKELEELERLKKDKSPSPQKINEQERKVREATDKLDKAVKARDQITAISSVKTDDISISADQKDAKIKDAANNANLQKIYQDASQSLSPDKAKELLVQQIMKLSNIKDKALAEKLADHIISGESGSFPAPGGPGPGAPKPPGTP